MSRKRKFMLGDEVIFDTKNTPKYLNKSKGIIIRLLAGYKNKEFGINMSPSYEVNIYGYKVLPCSPSEMRLFHRPFKNIIEEKQ